MYYWARCQAIFKQVLKDSFSSCEISKIIDTSELLNSNPSYNVTWVGAVLHLIKMRRLLPPPPPPKKFLKKAQL